MFGIKGAEIWAEVKSTSKRDAIRAILRVPGVATVVDLMGDSIIIVVFYPRSVPEAELLKQVRAASELENVDYLDMVFPTCSLSLSQTDVKICKSLQANPMLAYKEIATKVGISDRTARRRVKRMIQGDGLFLQPSMNARALEGVVWTNVLVFYDGSSPRVDVDKRILRFVSDSFVRAELNNPRYGFYTLFLPNIAAAREVVDSIAGIGITRSRMGLVLDFVESYDAFKEFIPRSDADAPLDERRHSNDNSSSMPDGS